MHRKKVWARRILLTASFVTCLSGMIAMAVEGGSPEVILSRGRAAALLTALFYHDSPIGANIRMFSTDPIGEGPSIGTITPRQAMNSVERGKVVAFSQSLIYEGGFYPKEIYQILGYESAPTARVARLTRQLDQAAGNKPDPWDVAGRVGRSGMTGASDHWAMAPAEDGESGMSSPGTLAYLPALAIVYASYQEDGREAAAQLATLKDDDMRAGSAARAAFSLLARIMMSNRHDKDAWLRLAAADSLDSETENDLRSVRVRDWRYLRGEECAMGRLERAVFIWYKGDGYEEIMESGRERLRSRESLAYLATLAAATYGMESMPRRVIAHAAADKELLELVTNLHDIAISEAVLRVEAESY